MHFVAYNFQLFPFCYVNQGPKWIRLNNADMYTEFTSDGTEITGILPMSGTLLVLGSVTVQGLSAIVAPRRNYSLYMYFRDVQDPLGLFKTTRKFLWFRVKFYMSPA